MRDDTQSPLIETHGLTKTFTATPALVDVDFTLYPGEVHALMGENGAGKSTLMKTLYGMHRPDEGQILLDGQRIDTLGAEDQRRLRGKRIDESISRYKEVFGELAKRANEVTVLEIDEKMAEYRKTYDMDAHDSESVREQARYEIDTAASYDRPLLRGFASQVERPRSRLASSLLREMRPQMRRLLVRRARMHPYLVNHVMRMATQRARILGLRVRGGQRAAQREALVLHERIMMRMLLRDRENYAL